ncbi:MAG: polysaccharide biosynthesis tyrosine autokinase [Candidatus Competibacteraceae bacterium]|nr:MAG: polysaccharide biosynthesis tyrosine autokinase [Candidatus Competibacteraceae bacterium]
MAIYSPPPAADFDPSEPRRDLIGHPARAPAPVTLPDPRATEPEPEDDEINLRELWSVIVKRRGTILLFALIAVIAASTATYLTTPIYRASLTLQIDREDIKIVKIEEVTPVDSGQDYYQTHYALLKSRSLAQRVATQLGLADRPPPPPSLLARIRSGLTGWLPKASQAAPPAGPPAETARLDGAVSRLLGNLTVEPVRNSRLVTLHYTSPDPREAATLLNTLASSYINLNLERRFEASAYARDFLQERLQQVKARLEDSEREIVAFARAQGIITIGENQNIVNQRLAATSTALSAAEQRRTIAEAAYRQMRDTPGQGLNQVLDSRIVENLKIAKARLEAEYRENQLRHTAAHPDIAPLRDQIAEIDRQINREVALIRAAITADYEIAQAEETLLRANLEQLQREVLEQQDRSIQLNILRREVDTNRELYNGLLQRFKEVGVAAGIGTNNISVVDAARVPNSPFKPSLRRNVLLALLLGLLGGIGLAFLLEHLDDTFKQPDDVEKRLNLPVLGLIPLIPHKRGDARPIALVGHDDPRSVFAESYRSLRTALEFSTSSGVPRVLTVTSATSGEGKSTTALSLAIQFAQAGKKVLLIDADLRKPSLHRALELDNHVGLTNLLAGEQERPVNIAQPTHIPNLFVIPAGPLPPNPAELLSGSKMLGLLVLAAEKFDQVLLDSPPIMGLADALILGNLCDGTLLTVAMGDTPRGHVQGACKRLRGARVHLVGTILNKLEARAGAYGYYHGYYYHADTYGAPAPDGKKLTTESPI